ncbi:MAG: hypothetical protein IKV57_05465 [Clostridia bacterium]|nr:hypothetical protein [Clostridia bacterium]
MGFGYLLIGFLFLINPVIHVLDVLPDCIGYFLIVKGLSKTALFVDHLSAARGHFWKLALITLAKFFSILFWPMVSASGMLLITFVFSIFEVLYFIPAIGSLYEGINFAALWYQGEAVYAKKVGKKKTKELGTAWRNFTIMFFCLRVAASIAPELTALQLFDYVGVVHAGAIEYSYYKPFLYVFLGLIIIITGLVWYIRTFRYWNGIRKDRFFCENLKRKYETDIVPNTGLFCAIRMKKVAFCYLAAAVTSLFFIMDGVNVLIGVVSAGFLITAAIMMGKYVRLAYAVVPFAVVRVGFAVWNIFQQYAYFSDYQSSEAVEWLTNAYNMYYFMAFTETVEYIFAMIAVVLFLVCYMKTIRIHLEESGVQTEHSQYSKQSRDLEIYNMAGSRLLLNAALAIVNYIVSSAYHYALVDISAMGVITIAVTLIWIAQTIFTVTLIGEQVYSRIAGDY